MCEHEEEKKFLHQYKVGTILKTISSGRISGGENLFKITEICRDFTEIEDCENKILYSIPNARVCGTDFTVVKEA